MRLLIISIFLCCAIESTLGLSNNFYAIPGMREFYGYIPHRDRRSASIYDNPEYRALYAYKPFKPIVRDFDHDLDTDTDLTSTKNLNKRSVNFYHQPSQRTFYGYIPYRANREATFKSKEALKHMTIYNNPEFRTEYHGRINGPVSRDVEGNIDDSYTTDQREFYGFQKEKEQTQIKRADSKSAESPMTRCTIVYGKKFIHCTGPTEKFVQCKIVSNFTRTMTKPYKLFNIGFEAGNEKRAFLYPAVMNKTQHTTQWLNHTMHLDSQEEEVNLTIYPLQLRQDNDFGLGIKSRKCFKKLMAIFRSSAAIPKLIRPLDSPVDVPVYGELRIKKQRPTKPDALIE